MGFSAASLLGWQTTAFSTCPFLCLHIPRVSPFSDKDTNRIGWKPTLRLHLTLTTSLKVLSPNTVTFRGVLRDRTLTHESLGGCNSVHNSLRDRERTRCRGHAELGPLTQTWHIGGLFRKRSKLLRTKRQGWSQELII